MTESFEDAFHPVLKISQFFGAFPLEFDCDNPKQTKFRWKSVKVIYNLIFLFCGTIECLLSLRLAVKDGAISLSGSSGFTYLFVSIFGSFLMLNIARKWPELMIKWKKCENVFVTDSVYNMPGLSLKRKIWFWASIVGLLAFRKWEFD